MSYVVQSSENTVKVILNSQLATHGTTSRPQFTLKTPITTPYDQTGLVNLENLAFRSPSMFTKRILNSMENSIHISEQILDAEDLDPWLNPDPDPLTEPDTTAQGDGGDYFNQNYGVEGDDTGMTETKQRCGLCYFRNDLANRRSSSTRTKQIQTPERDPYFYQ